MDNLIEITDEAITELLRKKEKEKFNYIRLGITAKSALNMCLTLATMLTKTIS